MPRNLHSHHLADDEDPPRLSDEELVRRWYAASGEEGDRFFEHLYQRYASTLQNYLTKQLLASSESYSEASVAAEDIAQEIWMRVLHTKTRLRSRFNPKRGASFRTWLFTIARNELRLYITKTKRYITKTKSRITIYTPESENKDQDWEKPRGLLSKACTGESPDSQVEEGKLEDFKKSLTYKERRIFELLGDRKPLREIAHKLGVSIPTAYRLAKQVRTKLEAYWNSSQEQYPYRKRLIKRNPKLNPGTC